MNWLKKLFGLGLPCLFHSLTGLYCPGCGGTPGHPVIVTWGPADEFSVSSAGPLCCFRIFFGIDLKDCL